MDDRRSLQLWDLRTGRAIGKPVPMDEDILAVQFGHDLERVMLTVSVDGALATISTDGRSPGWETSGGRYYTRLAISPDDSILAAGRDPCAVDLFDAATGRRLAAAPGARAVGAPLALAFASDGQRLLRVCGGPRTRIETVVIGSSGTEGRVRTVARSLPAAALAAVSPDLTAVATWGRGRLRMWDVPSGDAISFPFDPPRSVESLAFSADSRLLAAGGDRDVRVWQRATPGLWGELGDSRRTIGDAVQALAFVRSSTAMLAAGSRDSLAVWDVSGRRRLGGPALDHFGLTDAKLSDDGRRAVTLGDDELSLWALPSGRRTASVPMPEGRGLVALTGAGTLAAVPRNGGRTELWRIHAHPTRLRAVPTGDLTAVDVSGDGRLLASGDEAGAVRVWDARSGKPMRTLIRPRDGGAINTVRFSPDGEILATGARQDDRVRLWNLADGRPVGTLQLDLDDPFLGAVWELAFSGDGRRIGAQVTGGLGVWDTASRRRLTDLFAPEARGLALSDDGATVVMATRAGLQLWDVATERPLGPPLVTRAGSVPGALDGVTAARGADAVLGFDGSFAYQWSTDPSLWARAACRMAGRALSRDEWGRYVAGRDYDPVCGSDG